MSSSMQASGQDDTAVPIRATRDAVKRGRIALFVEKVVAKTRVPEKKGKGKGKAKAAAAVATATSDPVEEAAAAKEDTRANSPPTSLARGSSSGRRKRDALSEEGTSPKRRRVASSSPAPSGSSWSPGPSGSSSYHAESIPDNDGHPIGDIWEDEVLNGSNTDDEGDFMAQYHGMIFGLPVIQEESEPDSDNSSQESDAGAPVFVQPPIVYNFNEGEEDLTWILENMSDPGSASGIDWSFAEDLATPAPSARREPSPSPSRDLPASPVRKLSPEVELVRKDCEKCLRAEEKERQKRKRSATWTATY